MEKDLKYILKCVTCAREFEPDPLVTINFEEPLKVKKDTEEILN